jgi:hypothetical protein
VIKIEELENLHRMIRQDDFADLPILTWEIIRKAIREGKIDEAQKYLDYGQSESLAMHNQLAAVMAESFTYIAETFGEEQLPICHRKQTYEMVKQAISLAPGPQLIYQYAEFHRGHFSNFTISEDAEKYTLVYNPCGSGGRLRQNNIGGVTKKAYPWSWGKSGVPYYCTHCCVAWEILPTEMRGYPLRINLTGDKPGDPCTHLIYKRPELIPEEYFTRIGKKKTIR